ncbi:MAG: homocysteine S-methyltransferase family protein, partial [Butyrivibrio sp.]|nr:homocysteine S-methyltransferase family protein [Butyrivibrio sp.]
MKDFPGVCKDRILLFDGGMGSLLQAEGLQAGMLPEVWNITHADVLKRIHGDYLDAGCDIVTTNTFGANPFKYPLEQTTDEHPYTLSQVLHAALQNARAAVREKGHGYVALDMGPTGKLMEPMGDMSFEDCVQAYAEVVKCGAADADLILIETMSDLYELKAAVLAAKENCDLPVVATVAFDASGKLLTGGTPRSVVALLEGLRVDALGLNCGLGPADMAPMAKELLSYATVPVVVQPNAGLPRSEGGKTVYDLDAERFALEMRGILAAGASLAGGCCGTTPAHIAALRRETDAFLRAGGKTDTEKGRRRNTTLVTGFADAVAIGDDPVIIGERINPTGKKRFQQALKESDMEFILNVGLTQQEAGAHILDVNVGMPGVDEAAMMVRVVKELQSVTELPLQLDSSDPEALARAMRIYNGKPLINSVNGKQAVMDAVFPLVAKYGGVTVILCLDEDGIPETAEGRIRIAKRIIDEAASYGIDKKDLLIDALCMTISAEEQGALTTLETVRRARRELGTGCVLGVSNISFGLPHRDIVSAAFFTMAMENGLNAAIINPNSDEMMRAYRAFRALSAFDSHSADYVAAYGPGYLPPLPAEYRGNDTPSAEKAVSAAPREQDASGSRSPLYRAILKGLKDQAQEAAEQAVKEGDTLSLI